MQSSLINKQLGLGHPADIKKAVGEFTNLNGITEFKATAPTTAYKAQKWVYLADATAKLSKGTTVTLITAGDFGTDFSNVVVDAQGNHNQSAFLHIKHRGKTYLMPENVKVNDLGAGQIKLQESTSVYLPTEVIVMGQPYGSYPVGYKVFGYKTLMKADNNGVPENQQFIVTQLDYNDVYFPANNFINIE